MRVKLREREGGQLSERGMGRESGRKREMSKRE